MRNIVLFICLTILSEVKVFALEKGEYFPSEIILQLKTRIENKSQNLLRAKLVALGVVKVQILKLETPTLLLKIADNAKLLKTIARLENMLEVDFAEPNYKLSLFAKEHTFEDDYKYKQEHKYKHEYNYENSGKAGAALGVSNDPLFLKSWNLQNLGQSTESGKIGKIGADINVLPLWQLGMFGSENNIVAVIDTGVDWDHEDLKENIFTNIGESGDLATNGKDDDENGFIDDVHGWNFDSKNNQSQDDNRHGTHCAGIIGAVGNNHLGIAGVNWNVRILPIKFLDRDGTGSVSNAIEGMYYATKMGAKIFNISWGNREYSKALRQAIERANSNGIVVVAAAGNSKSNNDYNYTYPSRYNLPNIISVAASNNFDGKAYFSNYGVKSVDVAAPGLEIFSTFPNNQYGPLSGTSMAAPHVSGIAALVLSAYANLSPEEIKERLIKTSDPIYQLKAFVSAHGRVNAFNAVYNIRPEQSLPSESDWQDFAFELESEHPYPRNANLQYELHIDNAKKIRLVFDKINFETGQDFLRLADADATIVDEITSEHVNYVSDFVNGDKLRIIMQTNKIGHYYGFKISKAQYIKSF